MNEPIPAFEGRPVDGVAVKMSGAAPFDDLTDIVLSVDDVVQTLTMYRVVGVSHTVEQKTGKIVRVHTLRPVEMALQPLDPSDPHDNGIIRALPASGGITLVDDEDDE